MKHLLFKPAGWVGKAFRLFPLIIAATFLFYPPAHAYEGRFLGKEDIILYGMQLTAEPVKQTVPKNIATIVSTYMQVPSMPESQIPPLPDDAVVRATLRGPGLQTPIDLEVKANNPFTIPPMTVPGTYSLDNIRMVSGGEVLFYGMPESVTIEIIEKLLVTQVTARPLTAQEIRDKGIVFDKSNFQAYNFTAAFAVAPGREVNINLPVILPRLESTTDVKIDGVRIPSIQGAQIASVSTIIPDALKMAQTTMPNLSVQSFTLKPEIPEANNFYLPPIPGVIVIPGDIGFLNQYFSVMLMVGNVAPLDSNLEVRDIRASIVLPPGKDGVVSTSDDPLRMAMTDKGESAPIQPVAKPGPDGRLGTGDDIDDLGPGETGNAEYLVEGRREGSHTVEMEITGTLYGLPIGPVPVRGRAMGTVLVRNPTFTMTFTHPDIVTAGEKYTLDVTVTNTSESPANFVSVNLAPRYISGAELIGDPSRSIETIPPGDSASVSFNLLAQVSGNVFAATLDSDEQIKGQFLLKTSVGELGIPLSPDSLILPREANALPKSLRDAVLGMLGKAYATATAPAAALPKDVIRFGKKMVWDRGIEAAEAGFRYSMGVENLDPLNPPGEKLPEMASQLLMDYMGSNFNRIDTLHKTESERTAARTDFTGFDDLRRRSVRGDALAAAVADILKAEQAAKGATQFHSDLANRLSYRPGFVSVLAVGDSGPLPVTISVTDSRGRILGGKDANGKVTKQIPFSDLLLFNDANGVNNAQLAFLAAPTAAPDNGFTLFITPLPGASTSAPYSLSLVYPTSTGELRQVSWSGLTAETAPSFTAAANDPYPVAVSAAGTATPPNDSAAIPDLPPSIISIVQQPKADVFKCDKKDPGKPLGRVVAILFNEEVTAESVHDKLDSLLITNLTPEENKVVSVALQPGRRVAYIALRDPLGPFVPRTMTTSKIADLRGHLMTSQTVPMLSTIEDFGGVVSGRIMQADGTLVPGSEIRLVLQTMCPDSEDWIDVGIAAKQTDANAHYQWDYVRGGAFRVKEIAMDNDTGDVRRLIFSLARHGQRLNADIVFLGRGTVQGRAFGEDGITPLKDVHVKITNLVDQTEYGAITNAEGRYVIPRVPIGNSVLQAVHTPTNSHVSQSVYIGNAGEVQELDLLLLTEAVKKITVKYGQMSGTVLRPDGATTVPTVPVVAWYQHASQPGVLCPGNPVPIECPVDMVTTDTNGNFNFATLVAGSHRIESFDQGVFQKGDIRVILPADGTVKGNILLNGGFGTVRGTVRTADGVPVEGAQVGGGLVLATTDATGAFELKDVPIGHAQVVAVSQALGASGSTEIDIVRNGEIVNAAIVLSAVGGVYGTVYQAPDAVGNSAPAAGIDVYAMRKSASGLMMIVGSAVTDSQGKYLIEPLEVKKLEKYTISAFAGDLSDGNITNTYVLFNGHKAKADITFKGKGSVRGTIFDDDGVTPLKARVSVSGLTVQRAKGPGGKMIGLGFSHTQHIRIIDTDFSTGSYSFNNVFLGPIVITAGGAFSPDPITATDELVTAGETRIINLNLVPTSVITGRVMQPDGFTPVGVAVAVEFKSSESKTFCKSNQTTGEETCETIPQGIQSEIVHTLADGTFKVPLVNAGSFSLTATDPVSGKTGVMKGWVGAGQTADVKFRLLGQASVTINAVSSDGVTPIPGASVELEQGEFPKQKKSGLANTGGTITFNGIDEGPFSLFVRDMRNGFTSVGRVGGKVVRDGENVTITVHLDDAVGSVYGTVYRPDGITPVPNAEVAISNAAGPLAFNVTDSTGTYSQGTIPMGAVDVKVFEAATGRRGAASGAIDLAGQQVSIIVTEAAVGHVRGKLYDNATMQTLRGWQVSLQVSFPDGSSISLMSTTGVDGSFFFPGIPQGQFTLHASRENLGTVSAQGVITRENELVDIPMLVNLAKPARGSLSGLVLQENGAAGGNFELCIDPVDGGCAYNTTAAADGTFSVADISLGRHLVIATGQGAMSASRASSLVDVQFAGDAAFVKIIVNTLSGVDAVVVDRNNNPVAALNVTLEKAPDAGCGSGSCTRATDAIGTVAFDGVPPGNFTIWAQDPVTQLYGAVGATLVAASRTQVRIVLEINGTVTGTALYPDQQPRAGIIVELKDTGNAQNIYFTATDGAGAFTLRGVKAANYSLKLEDPLGTGMAQSYLTVNGPENVGTIVLDNAPPSVISANPMPGTAKVSLNQAITVTFSEIIKPGSVTDANVTLNDGSSIVGGTFSIGSSSVTFTPASSLKEQTLYTLRVSGITDNLDRPMATVFVSSFTTVDLTPPAIATLSPEPATSGAPLESVVRVTFNEPIDPAAFSAPAIRLTQGNTVIAGRVDMVFGNTGAVFTPTYPLAEGVSYHIEIAPATDLSGNRQASSREYDFSSTDRNPPAILGLTPSNAGRVIENTIATVLTDVGVTSDVAFVDYYLNDVMANTDRSAPFSLSFQAVPSYGGPQTLIKVGAIATDTSGNRGALVETYYTIIADTPPTVSITSPVAGSSFRTGDRVNVTVLSGDDVGVARVGYQAAGGQAPASLTNSIVPQAVSTAQDFAFYVPVDAVPGSTITVRATAVDSKDQTTSAVPVELTVLDATNPTVSFTGLSSGLKVNPGQNITAVVSASDLGKVARLDFSVAGGTVFSESRIITPPVATAGGSFSFTVSNTASANETIDLTITAYDVAGNLAVAGPVKLPVADVRPPNLTTISVAGNATEIAPNQQFTVTVLATDEIGVQSIALSGSGAFDYPSRSQGISPPLGSATAQFTVTVPANVTDGAVLQLTATATDTSNNTGQPRTLNLTVRSTLGVTLPASQIITAGDSRTLDLTLSAPAPAEGIRVDLASADSGIASITTPVLFASGERVKSFTLNGIRSGNTQINASIGGVAAGTMSVAVNGGIVTGTVYNPYPTVVSGAEVVVNGFSQTTGADGTFSFTGIAGPGITVRVNDPVTKLKGYASASMNASYGYLKNMQIQLVPAGGITGIVRQADATTPAGENVQVELFAANDLNNRIDVRFTDANSAFDFPMVTVGNYVIQASNGAGDKGRTTVSIIQSGQELSALVTFLGKGSVKVTVYDGSDNTVANADLTFTSRHAFGSSSQAMTAGSDGSHTFTDVFLGDFYVNARDQITGLGAGGSGTLTTNGQVADLNLRLAAFGSIEGHVYRADGTTPAAGVKISAGGASTTTDPDGFYRIEILPLGIYTIYANDAAARSKGQGSVALQTNGTTTTLNITLSGQGSVVVTVVDDNDLPVINATVTLNDGFGNIVETTDSSADAIFNKVMAGSVSATARGLGLVASVTGSVTNGGTTNLTIKLLSVHVDLGVIKGTVFAPDGVTPLEGMRVELRGVNVSEYRNANSPTDGTFHFSDLRMGTYNLYFYDEMNQLRARKLGIVLLQDLQEETVNGVFVGIGTVSGRVLKNGNISAGGIRTAVQSLNPEYGRTFTAITDPAGYYHVERVPVGPFAVTAGDAPNQLLGEALGQISDNGEAATADVILLSNAFNPPRTLSDGNLYRYDIQTDASIASGNSIFSGAGILEIGTTRFSGDNIGTQEDQARELAIRQLAISGLNVTRKVFVPRDGYFARYIEILSNPTVADITVDLNVRTNMASSFGPVTTSTGDSAVARDDQWATFDDSNAASPPAVAIVWGGAVQPTSAAFASGNPASVTTTWGNVTVPAGQSVALMHFVVQQNSRDAAKLAAERLVQLPPEALSGLSYDEIASIRNFAIPADGSSPVPSLPSVASEVTGQILASDGTTAAGAGAYVWLTSSHPLFARTYQTTTDAAGKFRFATDYANTVIPVADFTLSGRVWRNAAIDSPTVTGSFDAGRTSAVRNIVFSNTGIIHGTVTDAYGTPFGGTYFSLTQSSWQASLTTPVAGTFWFAFMPEGNYTAYASATNPQGSAATTTGNATVSAGGDSTFDLAFPHQGTVVGTVTLSSGSLAVNAAVRLSSGSFARTTTTGANGSFSLYNVPVGAYTLTATEPVTGLTTSTAVTVAAGETISPSVIFPVSGKVTGTLFFADGIVGVGSATIQIFDAAGGAALRSISTNSAGVYDSGYFSTTAASLRVAVTFTYSTGSGNRTATAEQTISGFSSPAQTLAANLSIPVNRSAIRTVVRMNNGALMTGDSIRVEARYPDSSLAAYCMTSSTTAECTMNNVVADAAGVRVRVVISATSVQEQEVLFTASGTTSTAELTLPIDPVILPKTLYDGNAAPFDIQTDGSIRTGLNSLFNTAAKGGAALEIVSGTTTTPFAGGLISVMEDQGREFLVRQENIAGLSVGRKVFVPKDGYFARYLEILTNPTDTAITVDVRVKSNFTGNNAVADVVTTSGGAATITTGDRWAVLDDESVADPFIAPAGNLPSSAFIWEGANASAPSDPSFTFASGLTATWNDITIQPGQTVAIMHFVTQQSSRASAQASAERLVQLPPEAIARMNPFEVIEIINFSVPVDGSSTLAALPALNGSVAGKVTASDGTAVPYGSSVTFRSNNLYYGRSYTTSIGMNGAYAFGTNLVNTADSIGIIRDGFTVHATVNVGAVVESPVVSGSFTIPPSTVPSLVYDLKEDFNGLTSNPNGQWRYGSTPATGGLFTLMPYRYTSNGLIGYSLNNGSPPSFAYNGTTGTITSGSQTWTPGEVSFHPGSGGERAVLRWTVPVSGSYNLAAGFGANDSRPATTDVHVIRNGTDLFTQTINSYPGSVSYPATMTLAAGDTIDLAVGYGTGGYSYDDTSVWATYTLQSLTSDAAVTDIVFSNTGIISGTALLAGSPAADAVVTVKSGEYTLQSTTPADGSYTYRLLPQGDYTLSASKTHPQGSSYTATASAAVAANATTQQNIVFPAIGTLIGSVTSNGSSLPRASVIATSGDFTRAVYSAAVSGDFALDGLPAGSYSIVAYSPATGISSVPQTVTIVEGVNPPLAIDIPITGTAMKVWDGGANTVNWTDASNWSGNIVPTTTDDVYIPAGVTVSYNTTVTVRSLNGDGTLNIYGGTLTPAQASTLKTVGVYGGTFNVNSTSAVTVTTFNLGGGTVGGSGAITTTNFNWSGGTFNGTGSLTVVTGGSMTVSGTTAKTNYSYNVRNGGTATLSGTDIDMYNGILTNLPGGVFNITGNIGFGWSTGTFNNQGTLRKTGVTGTSTFANTALNNSGIVDLQTGTLAFNGGGTHTGGTFTGATGTIYTFNGTHNFQTAATFAGYNGYFYGTTTVTGTMSPTNVMGVGSGTTNINAAATIPAVSLWGGTIGGSGAITTNSLSWSGGDFNGTGSLTVAAGGTMAITGSAGKTIYYGYTVRNAGTATLSSTVDISMYNGIFTNLPGGLFEITGNIGFGWSTGTFNNQGTLRKSGVTGTSTFANTALNNSGTVDIRSGTLAFSSGGTHTGGTFTGATGTIYTFNGTHNFQPASTFAGYNGYFYGTTTVTGTMSPTNVMGVGSGTTNINAAATIPAVSLWGGTIGGSGAITTNSLSWSGGDFNGTGSLTVAAGGTMAITGSAGRTIYNGYTVKNGGNATMNSTVYVGMYNGFFTNLAGGVFDITTDFGFGWTTGTFTNEGTLRKSGGTGTSTFANTALNNSGIVDLQTGTLAFNGGGTHTGGTFTGATGTIYTFNGTHNFQTAATFAGYNGYFYGTTTVTGTMSPTNVMGVGSGTTNINAAATIPAVSLWGGTIGGSGAITTNSLSWSGGDFNGTGSLTVAAGGTMAITGSAGRTIYNGYTVKNGGNATMNSTVYVGMYNGFFTNLAGGVFDITTDFGFGWTTGTFTNEGTLRKSGGTGTSTFNPTVMNNSGTVDIQSGTLAFSAGGTHSGSFTGAIDTAYSFSGTHTFLASSNVAAYNANFYGTTTIGGAFAPTNSFGVGSGTTNLNVSSSIPNVSVWSSGTLNVSTSQTLAAQTVNLSDGYLGGAGAMTANTFNWSGGNLNGTGSLTIPATGTIAITGTAQKWIQGGYSLNNDGNATFGGTTSLYFYTGGRLNNRAGALFDITGDIGFTYSTGTVNNAGTLRKSGGTGNSALDAAVFNNSGTVELQSGTLSFNAGGTHIGSFTGAAGTTFNFNGSHSFNAVSSITGSTVNFTGNTSTVAGSYNASTATNATGGTATFTGTVGEIGSSVTASGGTLNFNINKALSTTTATVSGGTLTMGSAASLAAATINLSSGTLGGLGAITANTFNWSGGTLSGGGGSLTIPATGTIAITGAVQKWLRDGYTLNNGGNATYSSTTAIYFYTGGIFNNQAGALFDVTGDIGFAYSTGTFNNAGTFRKSGGTGTMSINPVTFTNSGLVDIQSGNMNISGGLNQTDGSILLHGNTLTAGGSGLNINNGTLTGPGAIIGNFRNNGTVTAVGILNVTGAYTQTAAGTLNTAIGASTGYDQLRVTGAATLAGNLGLSWTNGFTPVMTDSFDMVTYGSRAGTFGRVTGNHIGGNVFHASYPAGKVTLVGSVLAFVGTVQGTVIDADGLPLYGAPVEVTDIGTGLVLATVATGANGSYLISDLDPSGSFKVTAKHPASAAVTVEQTIGFTSDGAILTVDFVMPGLSGTLPAYLYDASGFSYDLQTDMTIANGTGSNFSQYASSTRGGARLLLNSLPFAGGGAVTTEAGGREFVARQAALSGVDVVRKAYVPQDGYFTRYLDIFTNPGQSPVTIDPSIVSSFYYYNGYVTPVVTSSGDLTLQAGDPSAGGDTWGVFDDASNIDPFVSSNIPSTAFVWGGQGNGIANASSLSAAAYSGYNYPAALSVGYGQLTLQPGETIALMHFVAQQTSRATAQASAERLVQLPPEALAYLTPSEKSMVRNFAVPTTSLLQPLPANNGTITATVTEADGTTPVYNATVAFKSDSPYFSRTFTTTSNTQGVATLSSSTSMPIPLAGYTLNSYITRFSTAVNAPSVTGTFAESSSSSAVTIPFTGTGRVNARLQSLTGSGYPGQTVRVYNSGGSYQIMTDSGSGNYTLNLVPTGVYWAYALINPTQGSGTAVTVTGQNFTVTSGQAATTELTVPVLGAFSGFMRNQSGVALNVYMYAYLNGRTTGISRNYLSYYNGYFSFDRLPADTYDLSFSYNSATYYYTVIIAEGQTLVQDVTLHNVGTISGNVYLADGVTPVNSSVQVQVIDAVTARVIKSVNSNSTTGAYSLTNVATGNAMTLRASYYYSGRYVTVDQFIPPYSSNGQTVTQNLSLPLNRASLTVSLKDAGGNPLNLSQYIYVYDVTGGSQLTYAYTSNGQATFSNLLVGSDGVRFQTTYRGTVYSTVVMVGTTGTTSIPVDITLPYYTVSLQVTLRDNSGNPATSLSLPVYIYDLTDNSPITYSYPSLGQVTFTNLLVRSAGIRVQVTHGGTVYSTDVPVTASSTVPIPVDLTVPIVNGMLSGTVTSAAGNALTSGFYYSLFRGDGTQMACGQNYQYFGYPYYSYRLTDTYECYSYDGIFLLQDLNGNLRTNTFSEGELLRIHVRSYALGDFDRNFSYPVGTTNASVSIALPVFEASGTVTRSDGSAFSYGSVIMTVSDPVDPAIVYTYSGSTDADGFYVIMGSRTGDFTVTAQTNTGAIGTVSGFVSDLNTPITGLNITLEPTGSVSGYVMRSGSPVYDARVTLNIPERNVSIDSYSDTGGWFEFTDVPYSVFNVSASIQPGESNTLYSSTVSGEITADTPAFNDIELVFTLLPGTIWGTLRDEFGNTYGNRTVSVARVSDGTISYGYADNSGYYQLDSMPADTYLAEAYAWQGGENRISGSASGVLVEGSTLMLDLILNPSVDISYNYNLLPYGGLFDYTVTYGGALVNGWNATYGSPFNYANYLFESTAGVDYSGNSGWLDVNGQIVMQPKAINGKIYSRKLYMQPDGEFLRYLEIIDNPSLTTITDQPQVYGNLATPETGVWSYEVAPSTTGNQYAIEAALDDPAMPRVGMVLQGDWAGGNPAPVFSYNTTEATPDWGWTVDVPAGGRACIMHFIFQGEPGDVNMETKAQLLRELSWDGNLVKNDPLLGLTSEDRACIRNFAVPAP